MRHEDAQPNDANEARRQWLRQSGKQFLYPYQLSGADIAEYERKALNFELHVFERESVRTWFGMLLVQLQGAA